MPAGNPPIDMPYLMDVLRTLISINSVLPHEQDVAVFVAEELRGLGIEPVWHEVAPGRPNVYGTIELGASDRFLVFSGHSDTVDVAPGWETNPFELVERDGLVHGLGIVNMKGGIACQLAALKCLRDSSIVRGGQGRLGFAMTVDQEGESLGARALLATPYGRCDAMLHAEHFFGSSSTDYLPVAGAGKVLYRVEVQGRTAHGFRPHLGINAIDDAARIVAALDRLPLAEHPDFGRGSVCTLNITGGYGQQYAVVVPSRCEVIINRLLVPGETQDVALQQMRAFIAALGLRSEVTVELIPPAFASYALDSVAPILDPFRQAYRSVTSREPCFAPHLGITDANVFVAEGHIPTIVFGPKGGAHHTAAEHAEVSSFEPVARIHAETARRYLAA